jgi:autotransporter-associated beta strand protein
MKKLLSVLAFAASASLAMAAFTPITSVTYNTVSGSPDQYNLTSLTTSNAFTGVQTTVSNTVLGFGSTTVSPTAPANIGQMDDFNLNNLATGMANPTKTVLFGGVNFTNVNGSLPDFFLFEASSGANPDDISIAAIFLDDSLGANVVCPTIVATNQWGNTGLVMGPGAQQSGQNITGLAWDITDLKASVANGSTNLSSTDVIKGIAITVGFGSIDPCALLATAPPVLIDHFAVTTNGSSPQMVGVPFDVTITAQDSGNNTVSSGSTVVTVSSPGGSLMEFDWNSDGTYGDNSGTLVAGVKTIKARNKKAETATIVAAAGAATTPTPASVTTTADVFSKLLVLAPGQTAAPGTATGKAGAVLPHLVGEGFSVTVNAVDLYWNFIAAAPADIIHITTTDNTATLPADAALAAGTQVFSLTNNQRGSFTVTATNTSNALITNGVSSSITAGLALVWKGDGSANLWDNSALNWTNIIVGAINYANGDPVTFDDSGSTTPAVNIVSNVTPLSFTLNSANNYTFGSTNGGGISGTASLNKTGSGSLTLSTSNSYTGGTRFTDGTLTLSNAFALPTSGTLAITNSMIVLAATNLTRASAVIGGTNVGFAAAGANRSVNIGNISWGGGNFFTGAGDYELWLCRATDSYTLDFQSQIDFLSNAGDKIIRVDNGAAAVDAVISGRIQDNSGNTGRLVKTGAGTLQLSHPTSNYEVPTLIQDGTVILTGGHALNGSIILGNGATSGVLQLGDASTTNNLTVNSITTSGTGTGNRVVGGNTSMSLLTLNTTGGDVVFDGILGGPGANQNNLALTKSQSFLTLTLTASNTYSGPTIINQGTLKLDGAGSINNSVSIEVTSPDLFDVSTVTGGYVLGAAQTLKGLGTVTGNVTAKGTITPGSTGIGTLTFNNDLTLTGSTVVMRINNTNTPNCDKIAFFGTVTPGGSLIVTNIGGTLVLGNTFTLFSQPVVGSFSSIVYPPAPSGTVWTNNLADNGTISLVASPAPAPANITFSASSGNLVLNWPAGQGWQLQSQTNSPAVGLSTNWVTVPGAVPPFTNAVNAANGSVFYRLLYP